jgi:hypothetical protein
MRSFILILLCYPLYVTALSVTSTPTAPPMQSAKQAWAGIPNKADPLFLDQFITTYPYAQESQIAFSLRFYGVQLNRRLPNYYDFIDKYQGTLAAEQAHYELFQLIQKPAGYLQFVHRYPNSPAAAVAQLQLAASTFELIDQFKRLEDYDSFIALFPETTEALLAEKVAEEKALELERTRLDKALSEPKKQLQQAQQAVQSMACTPNDPVCWRTLSLKERQIATLQKTLKRLISEQANHWVNEMLKSVNLAKTQSNPILKAHHQRLVRRYCYLLSHHPDYRKTRAFAQCRAESRLQDALQQLDRIRETLIEKHTDLIQALQTEWEKTREGLITGFLRLHLDKLAYADSLDRLTQGMDALHQDLAKVNENLVALHQGAIDVQATLKQTHGLLSNLHSDLNHIHQGWVALNDKVSQHQQKKKDWGQTIVQILKRDFVNYPHFSEHAITQIQKQIASDISFQSHFRVYNTEMLLMAEKERREVLKEFMVQFIDAIKPGQGCGNEGLEKAIPDQWGDADFYPACQAHDKCYATCGYTQTFCDDQFLGDLIEECGKMIPITQPHCGAVALSYYLAVDGFGEKSWEKGQEECTG